jgi:hypothetical protein
MVLEVLPGEQLEFQLLTQSFDYPTVGHAHYFPNVCKMGSTYVLPAQFGQIYDFVFTNR